MEIDLVRELKEIFKDSDMNTGEVRKISSKYYKKLPTQNIDDVLKICESLLEERTWELGVIAYDWAFRMRKQYNEETFDIFESWLKKYVTDWGDCDDFCTHAFGELLRQRKELFTKVLKWTQSERFPVRRAAAVILIYSIRKDDYDGLKPLKVADRLMYDDHHLVLKGYGWMLKVLSQKEPDTVYDYVDENRDMPRVSLRYAIEKFSDEKRKELMNKN